MVFASALKHFFFLVIILSVLASCKTGTGNLFKAASPHEQYQRKLINSGLDKTGIGMAWINAASQSIATPLQVKLPYQELGYFAADQTPVTAFRFSLIEGQQLAIALEKKPTEQFMIYMDLWQLDGNKQPKLIQSADTLGNPIALDIEDSGEYILRLQPELLRSGSYSLKITTGPSLEYPVSSTRRDHIQSFFGDGRDNNRRKHEGIDFMAARGTPVLAIAKGTVLRVNENKLGGKVVWMRPAGKKYTLYYAHLDQQIASEGQQVNPGDTLGLIGNTGNAITTSPHLHFGIYGPSGAINPLPFVNPNRKVPEKTILDLKMLNANMRLKKAASLFGDAQGNDQAATLAHNTIVEIDAASGSHYRIRLPDGRKGYVKALLLSPTSTALRTVSIKEKQQSVYERADSLSAVKIRLPLRSSVRVLGIFNDYQLISSGETKGWIKI